MKAAVINAPTGVFDIEDVEIDAPLGREVLVEVMASGLCHTDLQVSRLDYGIPLPAVLGHELAGVVRVLGPDAKEFAVGDHVVASLLSHCGACKACRRGQTYQCGNPSFTARASCCPPKLRRGDTSVSAAFGTGAFAQFALVHENQLAGIPKEVPFAQASLLGCGTITGVGAVLNTAKVGPGETVVIIGIGGIGLNVISGARLSAASKIIAIDTQREKSPLAMKFGATDFLCVKDEDVVAAVIAMTNGGADHVFEAAGNRAAARSAIKMVRKGGDVYIIGMANPGETLEVEVLGDLIRRQINLRGVYMGSSNIKDDIPMLADLYLQGRLNLDDLVSRKIHISEINDAYHEMENSSVARCVITSF